LAFGSGLIGSAINTALESKLNSSIENESDIVFANNILPPEYKNTTVAEGIHKIMQKWSY
jgi:hypothetical protein